MLRALARLLRPEGRIAYTTIHPAPGLSRAQRRQARLAGPRAVTSRRAQAPLLASAGFVDVEAVDVTEEFARTARAWLTGWEVHAEALAGFVTADEYRQRHLDLTAIADAVDDGLLRRTLLAATRP